MVVQDRALHRTASSATVTSIGVPAGASRAARLPRLRKALNPEKTRSGLRDQAALLAAAIEALPDGVLLLGLTDKELAYNRKLAEMWHIPGWGSRHSALIHMAASAREPRAFLARIREGSARPGAESHAFVELTNGRIMEFYSAPQRINGTRTGTVFSFRDVTGAKRTEAHLRHCAFHDSLTGLPNRALLMDRINQAIAQAQRHQTQLALLFIDLDRFKCVNDAHGHHAGDRVLHETGKRLLGCVRHEDTAARLGGDEFVVLLTEVTKGGDAARVAIKVLRPCPRLSSSPRARFSSVRASASACSPIMAATWKLYWPTRMTRCIAPRQAAARAIGLSGAAADGAVNPGICRRVSPPHRSTHRAGMLGE